MDITVQLRDFTFDDLGPGVDAAFLEAWRAELADASVAVNRAVAVSEPQLRVVGRDTFLGSNIGLGSQGSPPLGTPLPLPAGATFGLSVTLESLARIVSTIWSVIPVGEPIRFTGGVPAADPSGDKKLEHYTLTGNDDGMTLEFIGEHEVDNGSAPPPDGWYDFAIANRERITVRDGAVLIGLERTTHSDAVEQVEHLINALEAFIVFTWVLAPGGQDAIRLLESFRDRARAELVGFTLPSPMRLVFNCLPQQLLLPGRADRLRFSYDGLLCPEGTLASSDGTQPPEGAALLFHGSARPRIEGRTAWVRISGTSRVMLATSRTAPPRRQVARYRAIASPELVNPRFTWSVVDGAGQPFPGATIDPASGRDAQITFSKPGVATVRVTVDDDLHLRDASGAAPSFSRTTYVLDRPIVVPPSIERRPGGPLGPLDKL